MIELTEIQVAMCKAIKECGFEGLDKVKVNKFFYYHHLLPTPEGFGFDGKSNFANIKTGDWSVFLDGHTLTQEEYETWAKQND